MTATSVAPEKLSSLKSSEPAQPMPAGRLEFWPATQTTGLRIILAGPRGVSGERAITQVYPPVRAAGGPDA